jgi:type 1 glutamine amidotransferase
MTESPAQTVISSRSFSEVDPSKVLLTQKEMHFTEAPWILGSLAPGTF